MGIISYRNMGSDGKPGTVIDTAGAMSKKTRRITIY
jgi:hypothetical protein